MTSEALEHTLDQQRIAANLAEAYGPWMEACRATQGDRWRWKKVNGEDYLYRLFYGSNTGTSLGRRSPETEALYDRMRNLEQRQANGEKRLLVLGRMYRAARLPVLAAFVGSLLREFDTLGILGDQIMVVGTHALGAYEIEAGRSLESGLHATEDLDVSWVGAQASAREASPPSLLQAMKKVDASWTVSMERTFQVVNKKGESVDVLIAPSLLNNYPDQEAIRAIDQESQEELLGGQRISQVVADLSGRPARLVAPDPRLFAVHKWLLAQAPDRAAVKRRKDQQQALAVRQLVEVGMPALPFDTAFIRRLSPRMRAAWKQWNDQIQRSVTPSKSRSRP